MKIRSSEEHPEIFQRMSGKRAIVAVIDGATPLPAKKQPWLWQAKAVQSFLRRPLNEGPSDAINHFAAAKRSATSCQLMTLKKAAT